MILPRWTAYVALAVLLIMAVAGIPRRRAPDPALEGAAREARAESRADADGDIIRLPEPRHKRTVVLGIDGLDPDLLSAVMERHPGRMAAFRRLAAAGQGVRRLGTSTPPQSPVAWSNFITGRGPGGHGIFDFIHRDPAHYAPSASTVAGEGASSISVPFTDYKLPRGGGVRSNRSGRAFWGLLKDAGVRADLYRVPIAYPVEASAGVVVPGMLTPALDSPYGLYTVFASDPPANLETSSGRYIPVRPRNNRVVTSLPGPKNAFREGEPRVTTPLTVHLDGVNGVAILEVGGERIVAQPGQWTKWVHVSFEMLPAGALSLAGIVRFQLKSLAPEFELYASPINLDPLDPADTISAPADAAARLAKELGGAYYTKGMPEDVGALKDGVFDDAEFMQQVNLVHHENGAVLARALDRWALDPAGGLLFCYAGTVDLAGHMMWRHSDPQHPYFDPRLALENSSAWSGRDDSKWSEVLDDLYLQMEPLLAMILERVDEGTLVIVMSDHGFAPYRRKFALNTWLLDNGYLVLKEGRTRELPEGDPQRLDVYLMDAVDWSKSRAYGVGFNGLYLNLAGREAEGIVSEKDAPALLAELASKLEALRDDAPGRPWNGAPVVLAADRASAVYIGARVAEAPDIVVGYNAGYGNSDESTQARIPAAALTDNLGGTFNGSHLMHPSVVEGVLLTNGRVADGALRLEDLTATLLRRYGVALESGMTGRVVVE